MKKSRQPTFIFVFFGAEEVGFLLYFYVLIGCFYSLCFRLGLMAALFTCCQLLLLL